MRMVPDEPVYAGNGSLDNVPDPSLSSSPIIALMVPKSVPISIPKMNTINQDEQQQQQAEVKGTDKLPQSSHEPQHSISKWSGKVNRALMSAHNSVDELNQVITIEQPSIATRSAWAQWMRPITGR